MRNIFGDNVYLPLKFVDIIGDSEYIESLPRNYLPETRVLNNKLWVNPIAEYYQQPIGPVIDRYIFLNVIGESLHTNRSAFFEYSDNVRYILKVKASASLLPASVTFEYFIDTENTRFDVSAEMVTETDTHPGGIVNRLSFANDSNMAIISNLGINTPEFIQKYF